MTLLRYCIDTLLSTGGYNEGTLQSKIAALHRDGGSRRLKRGLEFIQQVGNSAAHPGELIWNTEDLGALLEVVNLIGDEFHSKDALIEESYRKMQRGEGR